MTPEEKGKLQAIFDESNKRFQNAEWDSVSQHEDGWSDLLEKIQSLVSEEGEVAQPSPPSQKRYLMFAQQWGKKIEEQSESIAVDSTESMKIRAWSLRREHGKDVVEVFDIDNNRWLSLYEM